MNCRKGPVPEIDQRCMQNPSRMKNKYVNKHKRFTQANDSMLFMFTDGDDGKNRK